MKYQLLGKEIEISDGRKNYMKILAHFNKLANEAVAEFKKDYEDSFGLTIFSSSYAEKLSTKYTDTFFSNFIISYIKEAKRLLSSYGIYTITDQIIYDAITENYSGDSALQHTFQEYMIDLTLNSPDYATDSDYVPRIRAKFESGYFNQALRNDIMAICDYVLDYLDKNSDIEIQPIYKSDVQKAQAYYENLKDSIITEEQRLNILCSIPTNLSSDEFAAEYAKRLPTEIPYDDQVNLAFSLIELDPRKEEYYRYIFTYLPTARFEIAEIAKCLSIDISDLIVLNIEETFTLKNIKTEQDAIKMQQELQDYMERFGVQNAPVKTKLQEMLHAFDVQARTYDGILYDTREQCAQAEKDDHALVTICGNIATLSKQECLDLIANIEPAEYVPAIKEKFIRTIKNRILTVEKTELEAMLQGLAQKTESECNALKLSVEKYDAESNTKKPYIDRIDKRIYAIWDAEDFERFAEIFIKTPIDDSAAIGQSCSIIQQTGRTENKELFLSALYFLNEKEVTAAAKYALAKEKGALSSLFNIGKKDSYKILTLDGKVIHPAIEEAMQRERESKDGGLLGGLGKLKGAFGFGKKQN